MWVAHPQPRSKNIVPCFLAAPAIDYQNRTAVDSCHNWVLRLKASRDAWLRKAFGFQSPQTIDMTHSRIVVHFGTNDTIIDGDPSHTNNWEDLGGARPAPSHWRKYIRVVCGANLLARLG
jgi:hypothetical protein